MPSVVVPSGNTASWVPVACDHPDESLLEVGRRETHVLDDNPGLAQGREDAFDCRKIRQLKLPGTILQLDGSCLQFARKLRAALEAERQRMSGEFTEQVACRVERNDPPLLKHRDAATEGFRLLEIMRRQDDRVPFLI